MHKLTVLPACALGAVLKPDAVSTGTYLHYHVDALNGSWIGEWSKIPAKSTHLLDYRLSNSRNPGLFDSREERRSVVHDIASILERPSVAVAERPSSQLVSCHFQLVVL